jgi:ubiquinone/menaquinone biosynthesis C-methylase UbiE
MAKHVCPWWLAYTFDNPLRGIFHKPEIIFMPHLIRGMTAIDIGCGMGFFSIGMAKIVGENGKVFSTDIQQKMLDILEIRAEKAGVAHRIKTFICDEDNLGADVRVDFALAFWMAHETPDELKFLKQVRSILKRSGRLLLAEPKMHVPVADFNKTLFLAEELGLKIIDSPKIMLSHAAVLEKNGLKE